MTAADCGCWTDASGNWHLSEECRNAERDAWSQIVALQGKDLQEILSRPPRTSHDLAIEYFRQELRDKA